ncbi:MAG: S-layer homology domain-containing protein [Syntrophomonadaceae bacterium]|nr:S-layer homology domain-containing protein [Syntrophomonadaceae bacterium]
MRRQMKTGVVMLTLMALLVTALPAVAATEKADAEEGKPIRMVLADWGGVSLNLLGEEKYFEVWEAMTYSEQMAQTYSEKAAFNDKNRELKLAKANIDSYDLDNERRLAYTVSDGSAMKVYLHDLQSGENKVISQTNTTKRHVQVCGGRIAWVDSGSGSGRGTIIIYELEGGSSRTITLQESKNVELALTEKYLAYFNGESGKSGVSVYDLMAGTTLTASSSKTPKASLTMWGERLAWAEGSGATLPAGSLADYVYGYAVPNSTLNEIWAYDMATEKLTQLTDNNYNDIQPWVWDKYVTWAQFDAQGTSDILAMDLDDGTIYELPIDPLVLVSPCISAAAQSFIDLKDNQTDTYLLIVKAPTPALPALPGDELPDDQTDPSKEEQPAKEPANSYQSPQFAAAADQAITRLKGLGVMQGYPDGSFGEEKTLTRAEISKIAVIAAGLEANAQNEPGQASAFTDVAAGHWAHGWITVAAGQGFIKGDGDGQFRPDDTLTQAEALTVLLRVLGYDDELPGAWPHDYVSKAAQLGVLNNVIFLADSPINRAETAVITAAILEQGKVE